MRMDPTTNAPLYLLPSPRLATHKGLGQFSRLPIGDEIPNASIHIERTPGQEAAWLVATTTIYPDDPILVDPLSTQGPLPSPDEPLSLPHQSSSCGERLARRSRQ